MSAGFGASDVSAWFQDLPSWGKAAAIGGVGLALYIPYKFLTSRPRKSPYKEDFTPGVVYLYQFPRAKHVPNISNYCLKLETWLRLADISYEIVPIPLTVRSREGTLPFVELDGVEYHDSTFAIRDLSVALNKTSMEDHLTAEQKAICRAFEKMTELSFNISHIPCRIEHVKEIFNTLPPSIFGIFYPLVAFFFQSSTASRYGSVLAASGYGKHTRAEQIQIGCDDLKAISAYVGNKHFFTGFKPTRIDACLFGFLAQIVYAPYENEHTEFIRTECPNLIEYVNRIKTRVWPDWVECTTKFSTETQWKKRGPASNPGSINGSLPGSQLHSPRS